MCKGVGRVGEKAGKGREKEEYSEHISSESTQLQAIPYFIYTCYSP